MKLALATPRSYMSVEEVAARTFNEMLVAYTNQLDSRNTSCDVVDRTKQFLQRLQRELGWPWLWETALWEQRQSRRKQEGLAVSTRRADQQMVEGFTRYLTDPHNGWVERCEERFGLQPLCLITEANRLLHVETTDSGKDVRPATRREIQALFDHIDNHVAECAERGKGAITAYRDGMYAKLTYAFGTRRAEGCEVSLFDWYCNLHLPEFGDFGALSIRNGKAKPHGPPRRRTIYTSPLMDWIVPELERYIAHVRVLYKTAAVDQHLFLSDAGQVIDPNYASNMFRKRRQAAGIDPAVTLHSLRRSYATHHVEAGYDSSAIGEQMGHEWETSTGEYIYLDDDFRQLAMIDGQLASARL